MKSKTYHAEFDLPLTRDELLIMIFAAMKVSGMQVTRQTKIKRKKKVVPKSH